MSDLYVLFSSLRLIDFLFKRTQKHFFPVAHSFQGEAAAVSIVSAVTEIDCDSYRKLVRDKSQNPTRDHQSLKSGTGKSELN